LTAFVGAPFVALASEEPEPWHPHVHENLLGPVVVPTAPVNVTGTSVIVDIGDFAGGDVTSLDS